MKIEWVYIDGLCGVERVVSKEKANTARILLDDVGNILAEIALDKNGEIPWDLLLRAHMEYMSPALERVIEDEQDEN